MLEFYMIFARKIFLTFWEEANAPCHRSYRVNRRVFLLWRSQDLNGETIDGIYTLNITLNLFICDIKSYKK